MRSNNQNDTGSKGVLPSPGKKRYPSIPPLPIPRASTYPFYGSSCTALETELSESPVKRNLSGTLCPKSTSHQKGGSSAPGSQRLVSSDYQLYTPTFSGFEGRAKKPARSQRKHFPAGDYSKQATKLQTAQKQVNSSENENEDEHS